MSLDIRDYRSTVWTPSVIMIYATPPFCATIIDPKGEILPFQVLGGALKQKLSVVDKFLTKS
jgi:hypothetical protein